MLISEKLNEVVSGIHNELTIALKQMASYVETVEQTTGLIPTGALEEIVNYSEVCQATAEELYKYKMFFDLSHIVDNTDNTIEELSDRFLDRARLPGKPMTTTEAMEHFQRSRSTIYRWIKSGKVQAEKKGRRWTVYI